MKTISYNLLIFFAFAIGAQFFAVGSAISSEDECPSEKVSNIALMAAEAREETNRINDDTKSEIIRHIQVLESAKSDLLQGRLHSKNPPPVDSLRDSSANILLHSKIAIND